ncbi:MAG: hypothetical protein C0599_08780 [Salinivirgaceae bacterium]|nr:MAG: hypothetical protein C0599_08780 [Salinivirgaceae bacterium]
MLDQLKIILESLRKEVNQNLKTIKTNRSAIELLKSNNNSSNETKTQIETLYNTNKTLLLVNDANLKLQNGINQFIVNYKQVLNSNKVEMKVPVPKRNGKIDFFQLTVKGEIPFNEYHPKFADENFVQKLLDFYINLEDYEECSRIQQLKGMKQNAS